MALIPLNQKITITKNNGTDSWGKPIPGTPFIYDCRYEEGTQKVIDNNGNEVLSSATVYMEGLIDVNYADKISFTNELLTTINNYPLSIKILRSFSGEPLFTVISL